MNLLNLARKSIEAELNHVELSIDEKIKKKFGKPAATFVTLTKNEMLRGCIGVLKPIRPLWLDVIENAKASAFNDFRFPPLRKEELPKIKIEVSILSEPREIKFSSPEELLKKIDKKMGIILKKGIYCATFLPQVWEEIEDKEEFLKHLSRKASLQEDEWKSSRIFYYRVKSLKEKN